MNTKTQTPFKIAALTLSIGSPDTDRKIQILPDGIFRSNDTRPAGIEGWRMDSDIAAALIAKVGSRTNKIVVDYEHQTLKADENGQPAPASGWLDPQSLEYRPGEGIFAAVEWTAAARGYIEEEEYRYISPVFPYHQRNGAVLDLHHLALTNFPGLDGMAEVDTAALRASYENDFQTDSNQPEEDLVERDELIRSLGLSADATDEQITAALKAASEANAALTALRTELDIGENDDAVIAVTALKGQTNAEPDPAKFAPVEVVEALKGQIATLKNDQGETEVAALVQKGLDDGKLLPAQTDWATNLGNKDVAELKGYLEETPSVAALKSTQTQGKKPAGVDDPKTELNQDEIAICKQMGLSAAEFLESKKAEQENA